jgi:hypothetical protein
MKTNDDFNGEVKVIIVAITAGFILALMFLISLTL